MKNLWRVLAIAGIVLIILPAVASACPFCKDAKSDADYLGGTASLPNGFYYSILLMVCAPFVVLGTFVTRVVLVRRRLRQAGTESAGGTPPVPLVPDSRGARS